MIAFYASQVQYWRHLAPIADELRTRGHEISTWSAKRSQAWGAPLIRRPPGVAVVAGWLDARKMKPGGPVAYIEHGAGQTYVPPPPDGFAGAPGLGHVSLFLTPGEACAERWCASYGARVEAIGCPALDRHALRCGGEVQRPAAGLARPLVAFTSHWQCGVVPETMPALPLYRTAIAALDGVELVGHGHPRDRRAAGKWAELGVRFEPDPDRILQDLANGGGLLVADNTSLMYEAAALGIPVLALNAPSYRRDVEHGLRFWSYVPGLQVDDPADLAAAVARALADPPEAQTLRARAAAHVYAQIDGRASARAADAIERLL